MSKLLRCPQKCRQIYILLPFITKLVSCRPLLDLILGSKYLLHLSSYEGLLESPTGCFQQHNLLHNLSREARTSVESEFFEYHLHYCTKNVL